MNAKDTAGQRFGLIADRAAQLLQGAWLAGAAYVAGITFAGLVVDQMSDSGAGNFLFAVASVALGYLLTVHLLRQALSGRGAPEGGFGSYFGLSLLSGIAMLLGLLLLIVPGVVLFVRWASAYGIVLAEGRGVTASLSEAWNRTRGHFWPIALAMLAPVAINLAGGALLVLAIDDQGTVSVPVSLVSNAMVALAGAAITAVGIAVHDLLRGGDEGIEEIFA